MTCENIVARLIADPDKYQFGKNKLFFRAGQVAYMEKLRSDKLKACGIMIQKNVKMWLYRKKYLTMLRSARLIQRWTRGHLARRRCREIRRNLAAVKLQAAVRGWVQRRKYQRLRTLAIGLQSQIRAWRARREYGELRRNKAAITIQKIVRGWVQKQKFKRAIRQVIMVQCTVRRHFAKKEYKRLKIEAKSVHKQKELNKGLEIKIMSLQQKLNEMKEENKELKIKAEKGAGLGEELEKFKKIEEESKGKTSRIRELEEELRQVKSELQHEKDEKVDLVSEKVRGEEEATKAKDELLEEVTRLKEEAERNKQLVDSSSQVNREYFIVYLSIRHLKQVQHKVTCYHLHVSPDLAPPLCTLLNSLLWRK